MKFTLAACAAVLALLSCAPPALGMRTSASTSDRTITQVVKLLQNMLDKSKQDGDDERVLFAKHKCYCDDTKTSMQETIATLTKEIALLESEIDGLQADTGGLSTDVAKLDADMAANVEARKQASATRRRENDAFTALEADLTDAIDKMEQAIAVLADVGADQTLEQAAADHQKFMASYKPATLLHLKETVRQALLAASSVVKPKHSEAVEAFLQKPFTGSYTAQSGEVVGILKDMRDTFKSNLADARATEQKALDAFNAYMSTMTKAHAKMDGLFQQKQASLSANDGDLATKKGLLADAQRQKEESENFLDSLLAICTQKAQEYEERTTLRTQEEAAISEAIAILNSDAAFQTFGTVTATKSGPTALFQARSRKQQPRLGLVAQDTQRRQAQALLRKAAKSGRSVTLARAIALLASGNPFTVALTEIQKMIDLIAAEEQADDDQLAWCNSERTTNTKELQLKRSQIITLNGEIDALTTTIEDPQTGLKAMIQSDEDALQTNSQSQQAETKARKDENLAYQQDVENLVEAQRLLSEAISVLTAYYDKIAKSSLAQTGQLIRPKTPATWDGAYKGQSGHGGTTAISMLQFILANTKKEEQVAHSDEKSAQKAFEDSMALLTAEEAQLQDNLVSLRQSLAETEEDLLNKKNDLKATTAEKISIEQYLLKIKPGCDFITTNIAERKAHRSAEAAALKNAIALLKGTPAYQTAIALSHNETLGDCLSVCAGDESNVECKACLAKVTVPAYCAGHPGTTGC